MPQKERITYANKVSSAVTGGFHNFSTHDRPISDFYSTNPIMLEKLLEKESFSNVWECACGCGALSKVLEKYNIHGKSSDKYDRGYGEIIDFLEYDGEWDGDIITNPPYNIVIEFTVKCLKVIKPGRKCALLYPQRYLSGKKRNAYIYKPYPPKTIYAFISRYGCALNNEKERFCNSAVDYMWVVWEKGYKGDCILKWI